MRVKGFKIVPGLLTVALTVITVGGAGATPLRVNVRDADTKRPVEFAALALVRGTANIGALTDAEGVFSANPDEGEWTLSVSAVGYAQVIRKIKVGKTSATVDISLKPTYTQIGEVVVTAREGRGMTSTSLIDHAAMEHLQPSSFTDLIELLPGAVSKDPDMGKANLADLRQARNITQTDNYATSSLGTSFVVDGVQTNTNAEMQATSDGNRQGRIVTGKGVDMRSISTDDIESVEVVRGIASAEYGETTSGVVNIRRRRGASALNARFKADMQSQLVYVGKGVDMPSPDWSMNFSVDYFDSKVDPRNTRENFKRVTASVRSNKQWTLPQLIASWASSINYTGTFEHDDNDPDLTVNGTVDYYNSSRNAFSWNNTLMVRTPLQRFFRDVTLTTGVGYTDDHLHQDKTVASSRLYPMPVATTPGSHQVGYLPMVYDAVLDVYGKPFTAMVKLSARFRWNLPATSNSLKAGVEWDMSKNYGRGQVYDLARPITAGNTDRPRAFSDIPAMHQLSAWVENVSEVHLGNHMLELQLGLRETHLGHLAKEYYLHNRPYLDPRVNLKWVLPSTFAAGFPIGWEVAGGYGVHTKMPVAAFLYPNPVYNDYVELNYYHNNPAYRTMSVRTFVDDLTNFNLKAARNRKWEVRGDVTYRSNRFSVTYFREDMKDAFRKAPDVYLYGYNRYDASGFDADQAGRAPELSELPSWREQRLALLGRPDNSSRVKKEGVEFTFSSCRIPLVRTRITVSGAWFRTTLSNSEDLWYRPGTVVNGKELQIAGLYSDREGSTYQSFNTNFTFDTDVPRLGLNFSVSVQNMWFTSQCQLWRDGVPHSWVGADGVVHAFPADASSDAYLRQLLRQYTSTSFEERRVPVATTFNIKATKKLWRDRVGVALYVNRLISITPDYEQFGILQRRYTSPYFGMEINLKI